MRSIKRMISVLLCVILIFTISNFTVFAASYSSDYRYWSQGASSNSLMKSYGCWVVAQAKLIYESGINRNSSFNPDTYMTWQQNNGYLNSGFYQTNGGYAPVAYAKTQGKSLSYLGKTTSSIESKIWDNISKGYYSIIAVVTSGGAEHYVMIANSLSSSNGQLYCYNSYVDSSSAAPSTIAARNYRSITDLYTYTAGSQNLVTLTSYSGNNTITNTNAILWGRVDKPMDYAVTKIGIKVRQDGSTYEKGWSRYDTPSSSYTDRTDMYMYYDMNNELGVTLNSGIKYYLKFYAVVDGKEYWSDEYFFTTTGTHTHSYPSSWTTTKAATCTENGSAKKICTVCNNETTKTLTMLGHNYSSSWTVDKEATCTQVGSKSYHCTRCSSKNNVTEIATLDHSIVYGWKNIPSQFENGKYIKQCKSCDSQTKEYDIPYMKIESVSYKNNKLECKIITPNIDEELSYFVGGVFSLNGEGLTTSISKDEKYSIFTVEDLPILNDSSEITVELYFGAGETPYSFEILDDITATFKSIRNDVNGDLSHTASDLVCLKKGLLGINKLDTGDGNGDGTVNILDFISVSKYIAEAIS